MWHSDYRLKRKTYQTTLFLACCLVIMGLVIPTVFGGAQLGSRSVELSDSTPSNSATYQIEFNLADSTSDLGSISFVFCSNTPIIDDVCTPPDGLDVSGASLSDQSGVAGFSIDPLTTSSSLIVSRPPAAPESSDVKLTFSGITNPASNGSYYIRIQTYSSIDATGTSTNQGGLAFAVNHPANIHIEVPPYLTFCVGTTISGYLCSGAQGDYINFGELSASFPKTGTQQLLASSNAKNGYNIRVTGRTMTSGNNTINPLTNSSTSRPGTSQFGLNLRDNSTPNIGKDPSGPGSGIVATDYNQSNLFRFGSGEVVASTTLPDLPRKYTVSYIVNVPNGQPSGVYTTTMTYIALGNF